MSGIGENANEIAKTWGAFTERISAEQAPKEKVNHPSHYRSDTGFEVIDVIEAWDLGFSLGNAVKYIARAGHKENALEDLQKAAWYIAREIERLNKEGTTP